MKFSERKGYTEVSRVIQKDGMTAELRNSLWNLLDLFVWQQAHFMESRSDVDNIYKFSADFWLLFLKEPMDSRPRDWNHIYAQIRTRFFAYAWYEVYDFLEWILNRGRRPRLAEEVNKVLERELSGFRFVSGVFTEITDSQEVAALEEALADTDFPGVRGHLQAALQHLSNRENPDYRNSIKESISAVESMAQVVARKPKATLDDALAEIEKRGQLHPALKRGFASLYGYTSDEGGIRHAMLEEPNLDAHDAKFFLLSCTSFINYLKTKL